MLQHEDYCTGDNGEKIYLPEGTFIQITNWPRHRNKELWGEDADEFNPDRAFEENEVFYEEGLR